LIDSGKRHVERESEIVESPGGGETLLASRQKRKFAGVLHSPVVGHHFKNAVVDGAGFFFELALSSGFAAGRREGLVFLRRFLVLRDGSGGLRLMAVGSGCAATGFCAVTGPTRTKPANAITKGKRLPRYRNKGAFPGHFHSAQ
jgi:hypothetical protein